MIQINRNNQYQSQPKQVLIFTNGLTYDSIYISIIKLLVVHEKASIVILTYNIA